MLFVINLYFIIIFLAIYIFFNSAAILFFTNKPPLSGSSLLLGFYGLGMNLNKNKGQRGDLIFFACNLSDFSFFQTLWRSALALDQIKKCDLGQKWTLSLQDQFYLSLRTSHDKINLPMNKSMT